MYKYKGLPAQFRLKHMQVSTQDIQYFWKERETWISFHKNPSAFVTEAIFLCCSRHLCQLISYFLAAAATDVHFQYADVDGQLGQYQALPSSAGLASTRKGCASQVNNREGCVLW